ncbi:MAG: DNA polymerase I, partial [Blastocatellia bacterium]|nr:DNA polymerase I [Blastocatellia bacterium]
LLKLSGYEADDVIGTMACKAAAEGINVTIVSNDKDMCQLINEQIKLMRWDKNGYLICDREGVKNWLGVAPNKVVDLLGLMGDSSDNVPGAPGIGEKGALQIIEQFGSIESALEKWSEVTKKTYRESLRDHAEQIRLSRKLVTIETALPIDIEFETLRLQPINYSAAQELFSELEFNTVTRDLSKFTTIREPDNTPNKKANNNKVEKVDVAEGLSYRKVASEEEFNSIVRKLWADDSFSFAVVADSSQEIRKLSFSFAQGQAAEVDFDILSPKLVLEKLSDVWSNGFLQKSVHDSKSALTLLNKAYRKLFPGRAEIHFDALKDDTFLAAYLLNPGQGSYSLSELARIHLNVEQPFTLGQTQYDEADITGRLVPILREKLQQAGLEDIYTEIELPLVAILYDMEQIGIAVDTGALAELSHQLDEFLKVLTTEIYSAAGQEFNINSPQQLGEIFEKLSFDTSKKTKTGKISTSAEVLEELATKYELPRKVIEYREVAKLKNTYADALPKLIDQKTGRVHTTFNQTVTTTGRLSSSNPNLQNIPIRTEVGKKIRKAFVAASGYKVLSADYSQIELRLLAHITGDPKMTEAFQKGEDIHTKTAIEVFGAKTEQEQKVARRLAKATNFGIAYGVGAFGLSQNVGISRKEAKEAIENYYATYKQVRNYMEELPEKARKDGVVKTLFGRLRKLPDLNQTNHNLRARAEREAINMPIQGTAADLVKMAMIKICKKFKAEKLQTRLLLQVHDELLFEVLPNEMERVKEIVKKEMEQVYPLNVPLVVDLKVGDNWMELK